MISVRAGQTLLLAVALAVIPAIASPTATTPTARHSKTSSARRSRKPKVRGQRTIDSSRATEIQTALIGKKYLTGSPSGRWDAETQAAMQRYQSDHGWQTRLMPDSRALISLGLGPASSSSSAVVASAVNPAATSASSPAAPDVPLANTLASVHSISQ